MSVGKVMRGLSRSPIEQALVNLREAMRAAEMIKEEQSPLLPTPLTLLRAELVNAERYLLAAQSSSTASSEPSRASAS